MSAGSDSVSAIDIVKDQDKRRRLCRESGTEARHGRPSRPMDPARPGLRPHRARARTHRRARRRCRRAGRTDRCPARRSTATRSASDRSRTIARGGSTSRSPAGATTATTGTSLLAASRSIEGVSTQQAGARRWRDELRLQNREAAGKQTNVSSDVVARRARASSSASIQADLPTARPRAHRDGTGSDSEPEGSPESATRPPERTPWEPVHDAPASEGARRPGHRRNRRFKNPTA